jgi:hypothetical protein
MRQEHHRQVMDIHERMHGFQAQLYTSDITTATDSSRLFALADSVAAGQRAIELITFRHFQQLRSICTAAQQKKFDEVIGEALERLGGQGEGRRPGPPPGD